AVLGAADALRGHRDSAVRLAEIRVADRRAGGEVAFERAAHQHVAPAGELVRALPAEGRGEPALEDLVGQDGDAAPANRLDALVPGLGGSDLGRRAAEDEGADQIRPQGDEALRDQSADGKPADDRLPESQVVE